MPLFEGWEHVGETLRSVQTQTCRDYRVLISVDGNDERSADACQPFLNDERIQLVMQPERLGWDGNITWLGRQLTQEDFFCYWQHDDLCEPNYLEILVRHADRNPQASAVYCDMEFFGEQERVVSRPSCRGFALERVLSVINNPNPAVIRCLIRADALKASLPIKLAATWAMSLARSGELHRVPQTLYHRRMRPEALTYTMPARPAEEMWNAALEWGLGAIEYAYPLVDPSERTRIFALVIQKLLYPKAEQRFRYNFETASHGLKLKFVRAFLDKAKFRFGFIPGAENYLNQASDSDFGAPDELAHCEALISEALSHSDHLDDTAIAAEYVAHGTRAGR